MFNGLSANAISIYDMNARVLLTQKISKTMDILELNVSSLPSGSYIIALSKDGAKVNATQFIVK